MGEGVEEEAVRGGGEEGGRGIVNIKILTQLSRRLQPERKSEELTKL